MKTFLNQDRLELAKLFTGRGVEIGVAEGWYSREIMKLGQVEQMWGVDPYRPHQGYRDYTRDKTFMKLITKAYKRLGKYPNYTFIEAYSLDAAKRFDDNSLDWVYIDGDHSYEAVRDDIQAWLPKLKVGGLLAGDDYIKNDRDKRFYDVIRAVDEFTKENRLDLTIYNGGNNPANWLVYK